MSDALDLSLDDPEIEAMTKRLSGLDRNTYKGIIDHVAAKVAVAMEADVAIYPPAPADSDYRRTGHLGRSITSTTRRQGKKTTAIVGTNASYGPWTIGKKDPAEGEKGQAWMHKGRWTPIEVSVATNAKKYKTIVINELRAALKVYFPSS